MIALKCPVCGESHPYVVKGLNPNSDQPLIDALIVEHPGWTPDHGACTRCLDQVHLEAQLECVAGVGEPGEVNGYKILPTPLRLMANPSFTGKGVTICIIDSGFSLHPDLIYPENRILKIVDITQSRHASENSRTPSPNAWHGTMTSVVCAGNGHLSGGIYRGIASEANLVLLKVTDSAGIITGENIAKAITWAIDHASQYNIRIINLSVTDDEETSYLQSEVDIAVQRAADHGIVVVAAAGNDPSAPLKAPANAPHAITVGGLNDRNTLDPLTNTLYHSTYGLTLDQVHKPDLIAPAIWLPAPILPGSKEQREAVALFDLINTPDQALRPKLANQIAFTQLEKQLLYSDSMTIRNAIRQRIGEAKYISGHYQHADGTSFAAPIVCAVIAQMLEANPGLDVPTIREMLLTTAKRLPQEDHTRQGWGLISPAHAVQAAMGQQLTPLPGILPVIDYRRRMIDFYLDRNEAKQVSLTGDFLEWSPNGMQMHQEQPGRIWKTSIPINGRGVYRYKFIIDQSQWICDPRNLFREPDGINDFNSKLLIPE